MKNLHERIEKRAYDYFLQRGMVHGNDLGDWLRAEKEVAAGSKEKPAKKKISLKKKN